MPACFRIIWFLFAVTGSAYVASGQQSLPQLYQQQQKLKQNKGYLSDTVYANTVLQIASQLSTKYPDSVIRLLSDHEGRYQLSGYTKGEIDANQVLGNAYMVKGDYKTALEKNQVALGLAKKSDDETSAASITGNIGTVYLNQGNYQKALQHFYESQKVAERIHDQSILSSSLNNIGNVQFYQGNMDEAEKAYQKTLAIAKELSDTSDMALAYNNLGEVYMEKKEFTKALSSLSTAYQYSRLKDITGLEASISNSLGMTYYALDSLPKASANFDHALKRSRQSGYARAECKALIGLAKVHAKQGKLRTGLEYALEALRKAEEIVWVINRNRKRMGKTNKELQHKSAIIEEQKIKAETTLSHLRTTQNQLVQAEKMASLGELTAGIAHEIQNPLNFVNNFSEVSKELLHEMKTELDQGNSDGAKEIIADVISNMDRIVNHGKRADSIVKGMLQHSRKSSGQKEPTDINALTEEYVRLSYHGLRAKDKTFNAAIVTDFDKTIAELNMVPQEIGRVILNILINAFYAVNEKKKQSADDYRPTIKVQTKKLHNKIEISITDNGMGIPPKLMDKIFQPFFTTKPAGSGTGLGLSLSHDIISKGHAGTLTVSSSTGGAETGSTFIIQLPV